MSRRRWSVSLCLVLLDVTMVVEGRRVRRSGTVMQQDHDDDDDAIHKR